MKVLIFDTQTTGLIPKNIRITQDYIKTLPYIIQLSYIIYDTLSKETEQKDFIIKIPIKVPSDSIEFHGITDEVANNGSDIQTVVDSFLRDSAMCDVLVGHNVSYDLSMFEIELYRLDRCEEYTNLVDKNVYDTMKNSVNILKIKSMYGYKFPTLEETYKYFFGETLVNSYNAVFHVVATLRIYRKMTNDE